MIIKLFPKDGGYETDEVKVEKKVMFQFNVISCEIVEETGKNDSINHGHVETVLLVRTYGDETSFRFYLDSYNSIYLMGDDGKTVDRIK